MQDRHAYNHYESFKQYFSNLNPLQQAGFFLWPSVKTDILTSQEKELFSQIKPSGVVLFKRNFSDKDASKQLISEICVRSIKTDPNFNHPFMVAVDEEGGRVSRFPFGFKTKPVLEFVREQDKRGLKEQVLLQTQMAHELGVNCILAPVLDILTEPQNTVIGDRSFGRTPEQVCEYADIVFDVLEEQKIFSCGKHFPGHGNTTQDSHIDCAVSDMSKESMQTREWVPFEHFIHKHIPFIMAAHVVTSQLNENVQNIPATLNFNVLTNILRNELGFQGLILSDDLRMGAIQKYYASKDIQENYLAYACIDALYAGCDILLSCHSIVEENVIIDSIANNLQKEEHFFELCCKKAYRQYLLLSSHFEQK